MDYNYFDADTTKQILLRLRAERDWTQDEAAKRCGLNRSTYIKIENGWVRRPRNTTLYKIADAYGISDAVLLGQPSDTDNIASQIDEAIRILTKVKSNLI